MTRLVVFDLDGTLVDSRLDLAASANLLLDELGAPRLAVAEVERMVGDGARMLVQRVLAAAGVETDLDAALGRFLAIYDEHLLDHTCPYPGVVDALDALGDRAVLGLLTNKPQHHTARLLEALGLRDRFFAAIGGDTTFPRKPDPAALLHLIDTVGARPEASVMVGDSRVDLETARRAGTPVCLVTYGFGRFTPDELRGVTVCERSEALGAVVGRLLDELDATVGHDTRG